MKKLILFVAVATMYCSCGQLATKDNEAREANEDVVELTTDAETDQIMPENDTAIVVISDVMPEFPGGDEALFAYLSQNINYPTEAKDAKLEGRVYVTFVIEKDGQVSNAKILRDIGGGCGEEALRVVKNMPKWKPGTQRGNPVRFQFNLPVSFMLGKDAN